MPVKVNRKVYLTTQEVCALKNVHQQTLYNYGVAKLHEMFPSTIEPQKNQFGLTPRLFLKSEIDAWTPRKRGKPVGSGRKQNPE
jgi:hypothetical protein